jgi:hypothetical protein
MRITRAVVTLAGTAVLCTGLAISLAAQQEPPPQKPSEQQQGQVDKREQDRDRTQVEQTTITGCLNKDSSGAYHITDEGTGVKTAVTGSADLEKHSANHKVKLTGALHTDTAGSSIFQVNKLEHISATCSAGAK